MIWSDYSWGEMSNIISGECEVEAYVCIENIYERKVNLYSKP